MKDERNQELCRLYREGVTVSECAAQFKLSNERVRQILRKAGIFKQFRRSNKTGRETYLGINVSESTKVALRNEADKEGVSMSQLAAEALDLVFKSA